MIAERDYRRIERAIQWIRANAGAQPSVEQMAAAVALSPHHFSRLFRRWAGIPPHQYLRTLTMETAKQRLWTSPDLLSLAQDLGLSGTGRLHDLFVQLEAMSPAEYRRRGKGLTIRFGQADSPFGTAGLALTDRGLCALEFCDGDPAEFEKSLLQRWPGALLERDDRQAGRLARRIFTRKPRRVPLHIQGTNFQIQVWRALLRVPAGSAISYGGLAESIGRAGASRAVGTAVGSNPTAFLIPCHRVLRSDGGLGGYRWRPQRKAAMLAWENARPGS
jgi:AraC family transcriptional regulator of adaptative response/methylated-DNA-[protein]-cysteine methyltransferase